MTALRELLAEAQRRGLALDVRPDAPAYLHDAARSLPSPRPAAGTPAAAKLVVAGRLGPLDPGDWLALDLAGGAGACAPRALAASLAAAGAQLYEILRLPDGQVLAICHGVRAPEAVGPLFEPARGRLGALEAGPAASCEQILTWANAAVAGPVAASAQAAAAAHRGQTRAAGLADDLRRADPAAAYATEMRLKAKIQELSRSTGYRVERKLRHWARRLARRPRASDR
jgi:hypothetical protein